MLQTNEKTVTAIMPSGEWLAQKNERIRVAPYCRVSTNSDEQEHSFAAQYQHYMDLIEEVPEYELVDIYADEGISGRDVIKRDEFNRLISDCKKGKIDRVITKSVSRFSRNTPNCLGVVRILESYGVSVYFEKEGIDTAKMSNEILLALSALRAQEESVSHGNNMRWSYQKRMQKGEFLGTSATYGYILIDSAHEIINEPEAKIVRLMKDLYLSGYSFQKIANYLNNQGIKHRNGKRWYATTVRYILTNERYVGDALLQKKITTYEYPSRKIINDGSQAQYYVKNSLPALFSHEERDAILELMKSKTHMPINHHSYKLTRLLYCSKCGRTYRRLVQKNSVIWRCNHYSSGKGCKNKICVDEQDVIKVLIDMLNKLYINHETIIRSTITQLENLQGKVNGTQNKVKAIDVETARLQKQGKVLSELIQNGVLDIKDFYEKQNDVSARLSDLGRKRMELLREKDNDEELCELYSLSELLEDSESTFDEYDEDIIREIVNKIYVISSTEIRIELKCGIILTEHLPNYYSNRRRSA